MNVSPQTSAAPSPNGAAVEFIDIGHQSWVQFMPVLIALMSDGTREGRRQAREQLMRVARIADLAVLSVQRLRQLDDAAGLAALQLANPGLSGLVLDSGAPEASQDQGELPFALQLGSPEALRSPPVALLATRQAGRKVPLEVCYSARGYYLGSYMDEEPYTRESVQYWSSRDLAAAALESGAWTQRPQL